MRDDFKVKNIEKNDFDKNVEKDKTSESPKKQIPLRLSKQLYDSIARWSEDEFRSINGQIEYLLTEAVRKRNK